MTNFKNFITLKSINCGNHILKKLITRIAVIEKGNSFVQKIGHV